MRHGGPFGFGFGSTSMQESTYVPKLAQLILGELCYT